MHAYRWDEKHARTELGPASPDRLEAWLAAEEAVAVARECSFFGLYRSEADFIELTPLLQARGAIAYLLHSDRIVPTSWWRDLFRKAIERPLAGRADAIACARDYLTLSREGFERKYG